MEPQDLIYNTGDLCSIFILLLLFLCCCTLCMLCILHLIQKHIEDSRSLSYHIWTTVPVVTTGQIKRTKKYKKSCELDTMKKIYCLKSICINNMYKALMHHLFHCYNTAQVTKRKNNDVYTNGKEMLLLYMDIFAA